MSFSEQTIICADCGTEFPFTVADQEFFAEKGFSAPRRCRSCRAAAKQGRPAGRGMGSPHASSEPRQMFDATCAQCGVQTQVPFRPNGLKPVYCRDCFRR